jgi:hypothetical protein
MVKASGGGALMASLLNFSETRSLLELVEAYYNDAEISPFRDQSICGDNGLPGSLIELSLCADEPALAEPTLSDDEVQSVCADEVQSDVRLKTDIERVGTTVYGLALYHFRYKTGTERFEGVMAQDVLEVMPDAVVVGEDGYYRVKYDQLGIGINKA